MAQIVKLRRSSVSGQKPTNSNLQLGELALNTTDGKVYMAKSGSLGPSVEELITTNAVNTGSITISGSINLLGNQSITGSLIVSDGVGYINTGLIAENSDLVLTSGSDIHVEDGGIVSASQIWGDGSHLINIPASGVTGLELYKIVSGSVSASISPDRGLEINTDTTVTGSFTVSGSTLQVGNNTLLGTTLLSGSITISGSLDPSTPSVRIYGDLQTDGVIKFDPVSKNINNSLSASYMFVSSSTQDLYFSQNGKGYSNITRLRWLEGNLYSGLLNGGKITATTGSTTFNIDAGGGMIVNLNASLTDDPYPTITYVNWTGFTNQPLTYRTTHVQTYLAINANGEIVQSNTPFVATQYNSLITLGTVIHQNLSTVNASITYPNVAYGYKQRSYDFLKAFGPLKLSGLNLITTGSLGLNVGSGTAFAEGRNYQTDPNNPSYITDSGTAVSKIFRYYQVSGNTFIQDTNNGAGYSGIDPTKYVNNGVLTNVGGDYTIQRVFWYPNSATKGIVVYYGNAIYGTIREAIDNLNIETFNEIENTKQNAVLIGTIIIAGNGDFTQPNKYSIVPGGLFRSIGGSGGGGNVPTQRLFDLSDVDVTTQQDNDLLVYNVDTLKWESGKSLNGDYEITGSINVTNSVTSSLFTGSFKGDGSELYNIPASGVTGLNLSQIADGAATASISNIDGFRVNTNTEISGSLIIGAGILDPISPEILSVYNSGSYNIARFDGNQDDYVQINLQNHSSGHTASGDIVITADNGTENVHYVDLGINSSTYNAGYVGRENDAYLINAGNDLYVGTIGGAGHPSNLSLFAQNKWQNPQIHVSGSGQVGFNTLNVAPGYQYEFSGSAHFLNHLQTLQSVKLGSALTDIHEVTGSLNITGSLYLNGSIVGTGKLDSTEFYNYTSSVDPRLSALETESGSIRTDFNSYTSSVDPRLSALETESGSIRSDFNSLSSSISTALEFTGSNVTIKGDLLVKGVTTTVDSTTITLGDNIIELNGSAAANGGLLVRDITNPNQVSGSLLWDTTNDRWIGGPLGSEEKLVLISELNNYTASVDPRLSALETESGSIRSNFNSFTSSYTTGSFTGSFTGDASGLTMVPFHISGSDIFGTNVDKTFTKLQFDDSTGLNVEETNPGTAFISIGSHFKDIFVSGSPILSATGSDAFEIIPAGGIEITTSTSDTNGNGYVKELNISATSLSSSLNDRMDIITGSITSLSSSIITTLDIITGSVDSLNLFTSSVVLTSETGSMTVLSSSYALTASYALNAGGGAEGRSAKLTQSSPATTWTFNHNLGEKYPEVTVYDSLGYVVIPTNILAYNDNQMIITFSSAQAGTVTATVGGGIPAISASYAGYVLSNNGTAPSWKSGMVSGSLQISDFGYATTGSNTFTENQVINGTLTINNAKIGTVCTPLASTTTVLNLSTFDGVNMDYVIKKSGNMRAGNVMGVWSGSDVKYSETSTMDIGDTSEFTFTISNTGAVTANFTSGTWVVEIFYRAIGGCS